MKKAHYELQGFKVWWFGVWYFLAVVGKCQNNRQQTSTYNDNDEVEASPDASKVSPETKCDPLEKHLDCEEDGKDKVDNLEDEFQLLIVLQVDIFKAERQTANMGYWGSAGFAPSSSSR